MPIEFRCSQCNKLLRTGDDTAGKQAKCPECGTVMTVPEPQSAPPSQPTGGFEAAASPFGTSPAQPMPDSANPYQSPTGLGPEPQFVAPPGQINLTRIEFGEVFSRTWAVFTERWLPAAAAILIVFVINMVASMIMNVVIAALSAAVDDEAAIVAINLILQLPFQILTIWLTIGMQLFFLGLVRGQEPNYGLIFAGGRYLLPVILFTLLFGVIFVLGLLLFIIPGIIIGLMFMQSQLLIVDRNMGVIDAMGTSAEIMRGNKMTVFAIGIVTTLMGIFLGLPLVILTCGLGYFVVGAYFMILSIILYLGVTGQPTLIDRYAPPAVEPGGSSFGQPTQGPAEGDSPFGM